MDGHVNCAGCGAERMAAEVRAGVACDACNHVPIRAKFLTSVERRAHVLEIVGGEHDGERIPGEILALTVSPPELVRLAHVPKFKCFECGEKFSAVHLHKESDVPGECEGCAAEFFCPHGGHPDDDCAECAAEAKAN